VSARIRSAMFWAECVLGALLLVIIAALTEYVVLDGRVKHQPVTLTDGSGETWVIVGSDSRSDVPPGRNVYGTTQQVSGSRADVVLVVHRENGATHALTLPRDLLVTGAHGVPERLTLTWHSSPQTFVDSLCDSLNIPTTHLVTVDMAGFAHVVDALGGIDVTIPHPVRDAYSGLSLTRSGKNHLSGAEALALVRSRHPEQLIDGTWRALGEADGAQARSEWSAEVFRTVVSTAKRAAANPVVAQRVAAAAANSLTLSSGSRLMSLVPLLGATQTVAAVPASSVPGARTVVLPDDATRNALSEAGFTSGTCTR